MYLKHNTIIKAERERERERERDFFQSKILNYYFLHFSALDTAVVLKLGYHKI